MKAMILGAGLGTRLRPLTDVRPKVLAPVMGTTIWDFWVRRLVEMGCEGIAVNTFHLSARFLEALKVEPMPVPIRVFEEDVLLGTGGGIRNAVEFFGGEDFLVLNGDTLCSADLHALMQEHLRSGERVSLVLHDCSEFNNVAVDGRNRILGFGSEARGLCIENPDLRLLAFTGIHLLKPSVLDILEKGKPADILSIYRKQIEGGCPPQGMVLAHPLWREMGTLRAYHNLHAECSQWPRGVLPPLNTGASASVHPSSLVSNSVQFAGFVSIGQRCRVLDGAVLENTVLWDDVVIAEGSHLRDCIVADGVVMSGRAFRQVVTIGSRCSL
jgi:mannose-1-phosphate guanylyltransferase